MRIADAMEVGGRGAQHGFRPVALVERGAEAQFRLGDQTGFAASLRLPQRPLCVRDRGGAAVARELDVRGGKFDARVVAGGRQLARRGQCGDRIAVFRIRDQRFDPLQAVIGIQRAQRDELAQGVGGFRVVGLDRELLRLDLQAFLVRQARRVLRGLLRGGDRLGAITQHRPGARQMHVGRCVAGCLRDHLQQLIACPRGVELVQRLQGETEVPRHFRTGGLGTGDLLEYRGIGALAETRAQVAAHLRDQAGEIVDRAFARKRGERRT